MSDKEFKVVINLKNTVKKTTPELKICKKGSASLYVIQKKTPVIWKTG